MRQRVVVDRPCSQEGIAFEERPEGRFCTECREMQYDLTNATRREALTLIAEKGGRVCGTFRTSPTGEVLFRPEPPASRSTNAARGAALALALAACGSPSEPTPAASPAVSAPPASAAPPDLAAPTTPPTIASPTPPTAAPAPPATDLDGAVHATDDSSDPTDHHGHTHTHDPVLVGIGQGVSMHVSGGATAAPMHDGIGTLMPPQGVVRGNYANMSIEGPGTIDRHLVARMLATRQMAVRACYERVLRTSPDAGGELRVSATILPTGLTDAVHVAHDDTGHDEIGACAVRVIQSLRFAPPDGGEVRFTVTYALSSQDE